MEKTWCNGVLKGLMRWVARPKDEGSAEWSENVHAPAKDFRCGSG